ncbi:DKNYY domain-containing protein [Reichenbachiella sp.]|uniref:DKNYY domain-containing protein n=1 Tax=Reichenbachiella sp. TaxID=2184521 RepID=UPI003BB0A1D2
MSTFSIVVIVAVALAGFLLFSACRPFSGPVDEALSDSYYYNRDKSDIQYSPMGNWFELGNTKMNADVASFKVLGREYAKDKNRVYFKAEDITAEVDHATFRVADHIGYDESYVYVANDYARSRLSDKPMPKETMLKVESANPATFEIIDYDWSKDDKLFFYNYRPVKADYASFEILNNVCSKDKNNVYLHKEDELITSPIDVASVKVINDHYVADKDHLYSYSNWIEDLDSALIKIPVKDLETLRIMEHNYLLVDDKVYHDNQLMPMADRATFKLWKDTYYGADKNYIYYSGQPIEGADLETFYVYDYPAYAKDKNNAYFDGKVLEGVDLETFGPKDADGFIFKDKNHVYRGNEIVTE